MYVPGALVALGVVSVGVGAAPIAHVAGWSFVAWVLWRVARMMFRHPAIDSMERRVLLVGLAFRVAGAFAKYAISTRVYDGSADAFRYHDEATIVARRMRSHLVLPGDFHFHRVGTDFVTWVLALFYRSFGSHLALATAMFTVLAFAGTCCLILVAAEWLAPHAARVFTALVMVVPSLCFWSSSIGKEAWLAATMGLATLLIARLMRGDPSARLVVLLGFALAMALIVRPHVVLLAACSWLPACFVRAPSGVTVGSRVRTAALAAVMIPISLAMIRWGFSGGFAESADAASGMLDLAADETAIGGSAFMAHPITSLSTVALGVWTVLLRPHIAEAHGWLQVLTAIELMGIAATCLALVSPRRVVSVVVHNPIVTFAGVYVAGFVFAFSRIGNFGILARQRAQLWPLLFLVVAAVARGAKHDFSDVIPEAAAEVRPSGSCEP